MDIKKITLAVVCATLLAGCGSGKDKAEELVEVSGLDKQLGPIIEIATSGYASRYPMLEREQIRNVVREHVDQEEIKDAIVEVYADHFDEDELDLMIRAGKHPDQAMSIILGSKEGRALAEKVVSVQSTLSKEIEEALADSDEAVQEDLDDLKDEVQG